ncbi:amino acid permease [Iamia sp. SCSIO 61187]|uniref:amino acid permease n=1 Tax=Iamia sp. SCSIO 61187 TaxID=2722752 RepID=UPI001C62F066|nr:amino acid permease [Iamia sp. SCSIO 61187]QYG93504.1 amino acid permease [Iamia sp. SCSIO 61187]
MTATLDRLIHRTARSGSPGKGALGLTSSTALVVGSIIGTGVFTMPAVMAGAGTSSIITLGIIAVGALLLGVLFGQLTQRVPSTDGGLYAYTRHEFGDFAGYLTAWCYWITCWAGNAAIVSSWVLYVESFFGIDAPSAWTSFGIALTGLWIPAIVNLAGVRQMAWFQKLTVVLKFLPLLLVGTVGWFFVDTASFGPFNASGGNLYDAVNLAAGVALFSFIGVEVASIAAGRVRDPRRNVGRASVIGTAASGLLYIAVTAAVMGLVPHDQLVDDGAPFVAAFQQMFDVGWAGKAVALVAIISGLGALNGWTMVTAEMPYAAARDGLFLPAFAKESRTGVPWFGIVASTVVGSLLMAWSYSSETGLKVFTYLVYLSVVTVAIPYFLSACAQLAYLVSGRRAVQGWALARDLTVSVVGMLFSLWVTFASGYQSVYQAMLLLLLGIPLYGFLKARRERLGLASPPVEASEMPAAELVDITSER